MGRDLTLFMVDWEQLRAFPAQDRIEVPGDKAWPWWLDDLCDLGREWPAGWLWPPGPERAWCAEYVFFTTSGAYWPHLRAGTAWADMRLLVEASVREAMDTFLDRLIWDADPADDPAVAGGGGARPARHGPLDPARPSGVPAGGGTRQGPGLGAAGAVPGQAARAVRRRV
ncbi:hypothetical protein ACWCY1_02525 [Streptomyces goshikiensis]